MIDGQLTLQFWDPETRIGRQKESGTPGPPLSSALEGSHWSGHNLVARNGRVLTHIKRWPNEDWLDTLTDLTTSSKGEVLLTSFDAREGYTRIGIYSPGGQPLSTHDFPLGLPRVESTAFDGKTCYFAADKSIVAVSRDGKPLWTFKPPFPAEGWKVFITKQGLALFDWRRTVYWFALP